jgi:Flp pilus assembly protein TadD
LIVEALMTRSLLARALATFAVGIALSVSAAVPVFAQNGTLAGKVVDINGKPMAQVPVVLDQTAPTKSQKKTVTDNQGEWVVTGLPADSKWMITVVWNKVSGRINEVTVKARETVRVPQLVTSEGGIEKAAKGGATANVTADEAAVRAKRQAELEALVKEADAATAAGNFDEALAALTKLTSQLEKCALCHSRMGDVHIKKKDVAAAEKAYLHAIEIDPNVPDPYAGLAQLYNEQKRFDEATKMATKANELMAAAGGGGAALFYNQGVILWNQGKGAEAQPFFEKAIQADPKMADAHYLLGMSLVNQGKLPQAKAPFTEYLKLAPTGQYAESVKEMLKIIK